MPVLCGHQIYLKTQGRIYFNYQLFRKRGDNNCLLERLRELGSLFPYWFFDLIKMAVRDGQ